MSQKKETVGKIAIDLQAKKPDTQDPIELQREMHRDFEKNMLECIEREKHKYNDKFFVVVLSKREVTLTNVIRNYFLSRFTCPTPTYDQSVFRVDPKTYEVEYIWTIPDMDACQYLINNALHLPSHERELLQFVMDFNDGTLDKICAELNGENIPNSEIKIIN